MEQREKLIELILDGFIDADESGLFGTTERYGCVADWLIANGVVVLPCRCAECEWYCVDEHQCVHQICMIVFDDNFCSYAKRKGGDE